jgi:hypothetical protein
MAAPKHSDLDVDMPEDGSETMTAESPLDAEPAPRARKPSPKPAARRKVKEYEEVVPPEQQDGSRPEREDASEYESVSPLDADAEAALDMVEVDRIGPGEGAGWVGRNYDHGNGRGVQAVSYGRVNSFPDDAGIYERVQSLVGGAQYRFVRKGKKPVVKILGGVPLPLPSEQAGYPNGAAPNWHGGFERTAADQSWTDPSFARASDPFEDPNFDPEVGVEPEAVAQGGLNGFYRGGPYNKVIYYVNGVPSRPPRGVRPSASLLGGVAGGYEGYVGPDAGGGDDRVAALEKKLDEALGAKKDDRLDRIERALTEKQTGGALENMLTLMMKSMDDAQKARDHEFKMMQLRVGQEDKDAKSRSAADALALVESRKIDLQIAQAKASADEKIAAHNATILQVNATAAMTNAKEIATISAASNDKMFALMSKKSEDGGFDQMFGRVQQYAETMAGGKSDDVAGQVSNAIQTAAEPLSKAIVDVGYAWRGLTPPSAGGQPSQPPQAGQPALENKQQPGPSPEAQQIAANLQLLGYLITGWKHGSRPSAALLQHGCLAYNLIPQLDEIARKITMATPAIIVSEVDAGVKALGNPPIFSGHPAAVRAMVEDPAGRAWFAALQAALRPKPQQVQAQVVHQVPAPAPAPPATTLSGGAPPSGPTAEETAAKAAGEAYLRGPQ